MIDRILFSILADFLVNLAAGWFMAIVVVSPATNRIKKPGSKLLTINFFLVIFSLVFTFLLRGFL